MPNIPQKIESEGGKSSSDFFIQSQSPVKIRKNQAVITSAFLRSHFDQFVVHHMNNGSTGAAAQSAIEEMEAQL